MGGEGKVFTNPERVMDAYVACIQNEKTEGAAAFNRAFIIACETADPERLTLGQRTRYKKLTKKDI